MSEPWRDRHSPSLRIGRCCWVCGRVGGSGFTNALRAAGYRMKPSEMAYAHNRCMKRANDEAQARALLARIGAP